MVMKAVASLFYKRVFKRSPTILLFALIGAVVVEEGITYTGDLIFNRINEGKLWEHVRHKYVKQS